MKFAVILFAPLIAMMLPWNCVAEETMPASSEFAVGLYHQLDKGAGNIFFSPLSVRAALAMTAAGAKGKTLEEMLAVLNLKGNDPHGEMGDLIRELSAEPKSEEDRPKLVLRIANAVWGQTRYPFNPAFMDLVRTQYEAEAKSVDFANEPAARKKINDWVAEKTNQKILDLIPAGVIQRDTPLVLTNAVYFNAPWADPFKKGATTDQMFQVTPDKTTTVPTMRRMGRYGYADNSDFQTIELPYAGHETSMVIILPKAVDGMSAVESKMDAKMLSETLGSLKLRELDLSMPRFKIEQAAMMGQILKAMGMKLAFDRDHADFSGICSVEPLYIGEVLHKAFVKVDEEGTEAAAATAVVMRAGAAMRQEPPLRVQVDHPFLMVIRHHKSGEILFMGRVMNPNG
ncbi:MAG TPA: serpin family protein [Tepidisphaeraceae bacterium]|jgi:serpin B|nr:serpin family protein [Tepidisphaeraceae bacterium]